MTHTHTYTHTHTHTHTHRVMCKHPLSGGGPEAQSCEFSSLLNLSEIETSENSSHCFLWSVKSCEDSNKGWWHQILHKTVKTKLRHLPVGNLAALGWMWVISSRLTGTERGHGQIKKSTSLPAAMLIWKVLFMFECLVKAVQVSNWLQTSLLEINEDSNTKELIQLH